MNIPINILAVIPFLAGAFLLRIYLGGMQDLIHNYQFQNGRWKDIEIPSEMIMAKNAVKHFGIMFYTWRTMGCFFVGMALVAAAITIWTH